MQSTVFKEYDIRGKVGTELIQERMYDLGRALAYYFLRYADSVDTIVIGRDNRIHSEYFEQELARALTDSGINVILLGICPTPSVYFALQILPAQAALMVTASHNSRDYNGIKISLYKEPVYGAQIKLIESIFNTGKIHKSFIKGTYKNHPMSPRYTDWLASKFQHLKDFDQKILIDCVYGAAGAILPNLINKINLKNVEIINDNINNSNELLSYENSITKLEKQILLKSPSLSIAFDSDADRMATFTADGQVVWGDLISAIFIKDILAQHPGAKVIYDVKCSSMLDKLITSYSGLAQRVPCGHAVIKHEMKKQNAIFAGELSCHFYFKDNYFGYDDGIYAALRLIEILHKNNKTLDQMLSEIPTYFNTPEIRIICNSKTCDKLIKDVYNYFSNKNDAVISTLDGVQATLPYGWGLIRRSNTQAMLSLRFESETRDGLEQIKSEFFSLLKNDIEIEKLSKFF